MSHNPNQHVDRKSEIASKLTRLRQRMAAHNVEAVLLTQTANMGWLTAGASTFINIASDQGAANAVITTDKAYIVANNMEIPRLRQEEHLADLGFELVSNTWYTPGKALTDLVAGKRVGQDGPGRDANLASDLQELRTVLQPEEVTRLRHISALASEAMDDAARSVRRGDTEYELAARLAAACRVRGGLAIVNLIASDERISQYRHPLPTDKKVDRYAMLVLCMRLEGLIAAITRLVHFGPLPDDLRQKAMAVARIDGRIILGTRAGRTMGEMFALAKQAYHDEKYPEAIEEHHQGGIMTYQPREIFALPDSKVVIQTNMAFGWNPSVRGSKSEDTTLLTENGPVVLTTTPGWPTWTITVDGQTVERPAILEM